jgi:hypothetical protein
MALHFTYNEPDNKQLKQGDILKKTPELLDLIKTIHPHYAREDYLYFQVLTQTCDLVRRGHGKSKTRYITLATIRSLDLVVSRSIEDIAEKTLFKNKVFCSDIHKPKLKDQINKLLNNNDNNHFFLQAEPDYGLLIPSCTQLHLSISIKAHEHLDKCLNAKILELSENFRAKLGWLVGNLYSRVGTEDYVPGAIPNTALYEEYVSELLNRYVAWVPSSDFSTFRKGASKASGLEEIQQKIEADRERARETQLNGIAAAIAKPLEFDDAQKAILKNILGQHPLIQKALKS